jgi:RNA polymerase sigma-70 factor, ECF subfamily
MSTATGQRISSSGRQHAQRRMSRARGERVQWPAGEGPKVFVCLRPETPDADEILSAVVDFGASVVGFVPGFSEYLAAPEAAESSMAGNFSRRQRQSSDGQRASPNYPPGMREPPIDDAPLVEALAGGDAEAALELYRRHCQPILRFALAMTDSRAAAEDIVHDTFVELLQRPGNYDQERGSLRAFLYGIARHRIAKSVRGALTVPPDPDRDEDSHGGLAAGTPAELTAPAGTPEDQAERSQDIERLRAAIRALPLVYREVIAWCDLEEVPYATVADILDCPIGTVRSRLHRARGLLAEAFRPLRQHGDARDPDAGIPDAPVPNCTRLGGVLGGGST